MAGGNRVFITGLNGFVGSHLVRLLLAKGWSVGGLVLPDEALACRPQDRGQIAFCRGHLLETDKLIRAFKKHRPKYIFHLAAQANVGISWRDPAATFQANVLGTLSLLEAQRQACPQAKLIFIGSAEEYGRAAKTFRETDALEPISPYAASKVAAEALCLQYHRSLGLPIVCLRPFGHIGPGQSPVFAMASFAKQIAELEKRPGPKRLLVGNLAVRRDLTDVRDVVRAYHLAALKAKPGQVYNVCSGRSRSLRDCLARLIAQSRCAIRIKKDPARFRPADLPQLLGSNRKFCRATGWRPVVPLDKTLRDLLDHWRDRTAL